VATIEHIKKVSHAAIKIFNYDERGNADGISSPDDIFEKIDLTNEIISIDVSKDKSSPSGEFQFYLAPTSNWVSRITPGSWCVIMMSNDKDAINFKKADRKSLKMVGRITSARLAVQVDDATGARNTQYVVTGKDWGCVFESLIYIDPIFRGSTIDGKSAIFQASALLSSYKASWINGQGLPTPGNVVKSLKALWGQEENLLSSFVGALSDSSSFKVQPTLASLSSFRLPSLVADYLSKDTSISGTSSNFASFITDVEGILSSEDSYKTESGYDGYGMPDIHALYGINRFWDVLQQNANLSLNEMFCDIRWDDNLPRFALYRRIKPFCLRAEFEGSKDLTNKISLFKNIRKIKVKASEVIDINAGTNWRDRVNFIEMKAAPNLIRDFFSSSVKLDQQIADAKSIERDGFRPFPISMSTATYLPFSSNKPGQNDKNALDFVNWKYLLKEWNFNTHTLLNGSMNIVGQDDYIGVGDNIMVNASIFGGGSFNSSSSNSSAYLLVHVEGVSHNMQVTSEGARVFSTSIRFVRGVFTDEEGNPLSGNGVAGVLSSFAPPSLGAGGGPLTEGIDDKASDTKGVDFGTNNKIAPKMNSSNDPKGE
jgi:hypothetical protein